MLIHAPYGGKEARLGTWRALVEAQKAGKIRSLGVSNFSIQHLDELEAYIQSGAGGQISVGQYEIHPWCPREDVVGWLHKRNAVVEAYSPLVQATRMKESVLQTPAQILVRWSLQKVCQMNAFVEHHLTDFLLFSGIRAAAQVGDRLAYPGELAGFRLRVVRGRYD